ncbi:MAG: hypothetical protein U9N85_13030 [Bacteroidota bacterium]|nr:hypothetical protein [Bacteroidota bacterium]
MKNMIITQYFKTPYGKLILGTFENKRCPADRRYRKMRDSINRRIQ